MCIDTNAVNPFLSEISDNSGIKTPQKLCILLANLLLYTPSTDPLQNKKKEFRLRSHTKLSLSQIPALPLTSCVDPAESLTSLNSYFLTYFFLFNLE